jgi:hypothetical protein
VLTAPTLLLLQEVYARPEFQGSFDAVVTCFFIDTAHNILEYLEVIHGVLKPGGVWIHLGPLLWHWADGGSWEDRSIELSLDDVQAAAQLMGLELLQKQFVEAAYIGEPGLGGGGGGAGANKGLLSGEECLCACAALGAVVHAAACRRSLLMLAGQGILVAAGPDHGMQLRRAVGARLPVTCAAANTRSMYRTVYQAAFWTMVKTDASLPTDLTELVKLLAANKARQQGTQEQQQQNQQQVEQLSTQHVHPVEQQQQQSDQLNWRAAAVLRAGGDVGLS